MAFCWDPKRPNQPNFSARLTLVGNSVGIRSDMRYRSPGSCVHWSPKAQAHIITLGYSGLRLSLSLHVVLVLKHTMNELFAFIRLYKISIYRPHSTEISINATKRFNIGGRRLQSLSITSPGLLAWCQECQAFWNAWLSLQCLTCSTTISLRIDNAYTDKKHGRSMSIEGGSLIHCSKAVGRGKEGRRISDIIYVLKRCKKNLPGQYSRRWIMTYGQRSLLRIGRY